MSNQFDAPAKITRDITDYDGLSYKQRACWLIAWIWNANLEQGVRQLYECPPPQRISDLFEIEPGTQRYLHYLRGQRMLKTTTVAGHQVNWAPTPEGQRMLNEILDEARGHVPEDSPYVELRDNKRRDIGLIGDHPSSIAHRYMIARMIGIANEGGWRVGLGKENAVHDLALKPPGLVWIPVEAWAKNNNQGKWYNSYQQLRELGAPIIHLVESGELLRKLLGTWDQGDLVDLSSDPRDWKGNFNRTHALSLLEDDWLNQPQEHSAAGDIITAGVLEDATPNDILTHFRAQTRRFGILIEDR